MNTKISFLSREQELKKCFIQLGVKFGLPRELVMLLYNYTHVSEREEYDLTRMFHKNMILFMCLDSRGTLDTLSEPRSKSGKPRLAILSWKQRYREHIEDGRCFMKDDLYSHRLPMDKNCEWGIMHSQLSRRKPIKDGEFVSGFYDLREKMLCEIRIIGEEGYLWKITQYPDKSGEYEDIWTEEPLETRDKIHYLNTSPWEEIEIDYETYLDWKDTPEGPSWRVFVDGYGEGATL